MEGLFNSAIALYGFSFVVLSLVGLVGGVFELAFKLYYEQLLYRMVLHVVCLPFAL